MNINNISLEKHELLTMFVNVFSLGIGVAFGAMAAFYISEAILSRGQFIGLFPMPARLLPPTLFVAFAHLATIASFVFYCLESKTASIFYMLSLWVRGLLIEMFGACTVCCMICSTVIMYCYFHGIDITNMHSHFIDLITFAGAFSGVLIGGIYGLYFKKHWQF